MLPRASDTGWPSLSGTIVSIVSSNSACHHLLLRHRRRIDFENPAQAIGLGIMRARDEGAADLGRIPAGDDTAAERFFGLDVTGREILHQVLSVCAARSCIEVAWLRVQE